MLTSKIRNKFGSEALHTQNIYFDLVSQGPDLETSDSMVHQQHIQTDIKQGNTNRQYDTLDGG